MAIHVLGTLIKSLHQRLSNLYLHTDDSIIYLIRQDERTGRKYWKENSQRSNEENNV